jgi:hypothetical protein
MHDHNHHHQHPPRKKLHQDWRLWVVVGLMLLAMVVYLFTQDEGIVPGGPRPGANPPAPAQQ